MHAADLLRDLLANGPLQRTAAPFCLLQVTGPDAGEFLHRLSSMDVLGLGDSQVRPAAFLDSKGRLVVTCLVFRLGDTFWLETQADQHERLAALLERYHFNEKLTIVRPQVGPCWEGVTFASNVPAQDWSARLLDGHPMVRCARRSVAFTRLHGAAVGTVDLHDGGRTTPTSMQPLTAGHAECLRMLAGFVRVGVETEPTTLALEADLDDHISTTKGCYTGQEIVARIHTYGHTNRRLCLLLLAPGAPITAPQPLHEREDGLAVGRVMQAVPIPGRAQRLGVGYLPKDFQALGTQLALADGAAVEVIGYEPLPAQASAT